MRQELMEQTLRVVVRVCSRHKHVQCAFSLAGSVVTEDDQWEWAKEQAVVGHMEPTMRNKGLDPGAPCLRCGDTTWVYEFVPASFGSVEEAGRFIEGLSEDSDHSVMYTFPEGRRIEHHTTPPAGA